LRLNLGCGSMPEPGYTNVDAVQQPGVDEVWDLDLYPWPWRDEAAERIRAFDVFEHLWHPLDFMRECWRVLRPGGILDIHTVHWRSPNYHRDPDHKRASDDHSWDYWIPGTELNARYGASYAQGCHFEKVSIALVDGMELAVVLRRL
jgi:SAM-dependent methyltransferase